MDTFKLRCLQYGSIKLMLFTVWTHQTNVYYSMDRSNLHCLVYGFTKRMLSRSYTHEIYAVYSIHLNLRCLQYGSIEITFPTE